MERKICMNYQAVITFFFLGLLPGYLIALLFGIATNNVKLIVIYGPIFGSIIGFVLHQIIKNKRNTDYLLKQNNLMNMLLMGFLVLGVLILLLKFI